MDWVKWAGVLDDGECMHGGQKVCDAFDVETGYQIYVSYNSPIHT